MTIEGAVRVLAGSFVLLGLLLSQLVSPWWLLLDAFVGLNLIQSAFTGICPAASIFRRLGIGKGPRVGPTGTDVPLATR